MRVIAGVAKGHPLKAARTGSVRPTSDLVRGAIFNMIGPYFSEETRVLDLYAGTGAMGIEALSRGAAWADFVEQEARSCAAIEENLQRTGFADRALVHNGTVARALNRISDSYALIILDPPYAQPVDQDVIVKLIEGNILEPDGQLVLERSTRTTDALDFPDLHLVKQRRHGDTMVWVFIREGARIG